MKQYIGQTVDMFRSRWNNYKDNSRKFDRGEDCMQRYLESAFFLCETPIYYPSGKQSNTTKNI